MKQSMLNKKRNLKPGEIIKLAYDQAFKIMYGSSDHIEILTMLLSKILEVDYNDLVGKITLLPLNVQNKTIGEKKSERDVVVSVKTDKNYRIVLEVNVKKEFYESVINRYTFDISKKILEGKNYKQGQMHMAFLGNPGTGKTTVARIVGRILYENGLINNDNVVEVKFSDLYQNYVGFSAKATREKIKEAEGGVLFIDEAHQLCSAGSDNKDFRKEIINTLIPELENNHNLLVIFAGYSKEMLHMLKGSDKGLFSRVNHRVDFKDFSKNDIMNLFNLEMKKRKNRKDESFELTAEATKMVSNYFDILIKARKDNFANGREVRITIEKILNKFGVIALNREDIKTIDGGTMKQILTSSTFKNEILSDNKNNTVLNIEWEEFSEELSHEN